MLEDATCQAARRANWPVVSLACAGPRWMFPWIRSSVPWRHAERICKDSVRLPGHVISIDAIFGMPGQKPILRRESGMSAEPYVGGAPLAIREVGTLTGVHRGLDSVMQF